jgi:ABC-type Mn2+/Zn2+ transport system permease subunit
MVVASAIGGASAVIGLAAARQWGLAPGGTIVLVAAAVFAITAARPFLNIFRP